MLPEKPWRGEIVMLFIAAQFLCLSFGVADIGLLHKPGICGFKQPEDFGNVLLGTPCFQGATWILTPIFLRLHQTRWREAFGLHGKKPDAIAGDRCGRCRRDFAGRVAAAKRVRRRARSDAPYPDCL